MPFDDRFLECWQDSENQAIMANIAKSFPTVPIEYHEEIKQDSLENCLESFIPDGTVRFTTSLHRFVRWGFLDASKKIARRRNLAKIVSLDEVGDIPEKVSHHSLYDEVFDAMEHLGERSRGIIKAHYIHNKSLREIARSLGCGKSRVRRELSVEIQRLQSLCGVLPLVDSPNEVTELHQNGYG